MAPSKQIYRKMMKGTQGERLINKIGDGSVCNSLASLFGRGPIRTLDLTGTDSVHFVGATNSEVRDYSLKSLLLSLSDSDKRQPDPLPLYPLYMRAIDHKWPLQARHLNPQLQCRSSDHGSLTFQPAST